MDKYSNEAFLLVRKTNNTLQTIHACNIGTKIHTFICTEENCAQNIISHTDYPHAYIFIVHA